MIRLAGIALVLALASTAPARADCGATPGPCQIADGEYHVALPDMPAPEMPVVLFLHGAGGTGASSIGNRRMVDPITARGYAVIAPTGSRNFRGGAGRAWAFRADRGAGRDEATFLRAVVADAARRFGTSPDRVLMAGFSNGGFMVYYLACAAPETFTAYASVSGGFWRPQPEACAGPVKLLHTHGWRDPTVPLEGRPLRNGAFVQGDIFAGLETWRLANGCARHDPTGFGETGPFWIRKWERCAPGSALELAIFPGAHTVPDGWADMALDWFETVAPGPAN